MPKRILYFEIHFHLETRDVCSLSFVVKLMDIVPKCSTSLIVAAYLVFCLWCRRHDTSTVGNRLVFCICNFCGCQGQCFGTVLFVLANIKSFLPIGSERKYKVSHFMLLVTQGVVRLCIFPFLMVFFAARFIYCRWCKLSRCHGNCFCRRPLSFATKIKVCFSFANLGVFSFHSSNLSLTW